MMNGSLDAGRTIGCMAWDPGCDRLAVGFGEAHLDVGQVALYSTSCQPVVSAQFIGNIKVDGSKEPVKAVKFHSQYSRGALLAILSSSRQTNVVPLFYS